MHFYLYIITNNANGKIYAGVHKTTDLDDGYMGSGKIIKAAIKKHGIENFTKEIVAFFDNADDMFAAEKELVTDEFLLREDTYNLRRGGTGGFGPFHKQLAICKIKSNVMDRISGYNNNPSVCAECKAPLEYHRKNYKFCNSKCAATFNNKKRGKPDAETNNKRSIALQSRAKTAGHKQSISASMISARWVWVHHELVGAKKCKFDLLPLYIDQGWVKGR